MTRESALLAVIADLSIDRESLIVQRDALKAENEQLRAIIADLERLAAQAEPPSTD